LGQIIQTVSENIFKVDIPESPCRTTIQNIIEPGAACISVVALICVLIHLSPFVHLSSFQLYLSSNLFGQIFSDFAVDLPCDKMGQIIQTVSENIKVDILKIPCRTTIH
jgi:hypothetical protein